MDNDWDVAVIGGGGAGLAAAVAAAEEGARVVLFESQHELGGSTQESAGLFTAAGTSVQAALGIQDDADKFFQHYMDLNQWKLKPGLIRTFCAEAAPTFEWMLGLGVEVPAKISGNAHSPGLTQAGVEDIWRGHVPVDQGYGLVQVFARAAKERGVDIVLGSRVEDVLHTDGRVAGVRVDGVDLPTSSVIVASGGLSSNRALVERFYPDALLAGDSGFVVATPGAQGDHIGFAEDVGAAISGDGWGLLLITAAFQRYHHWQAGFPPLSRVYVDSEGDRFMNEDASYAVAEGIFRRHGGYAWAIFDQAALEALPQGHADWCVERVADSVARGESFSADSLEALALAVQINPRRLVSTIERWNATLPLGRDDEFLRHESLATKKVTDPLTPIATGPFYAVKMLPGELVCTHAGIRIDGQARALTPEDRIIDGLFAAGEAGAGILGERYVGGGNSIANSLTMGRLAGRSAARRANGAG